MVVQVSAENLGRDVPTGTPRVGTRVAIKPGICKPIMWFRGCWVVAPI